MARVRGIGIETLLTPFRAPQAHAIAERFVRTVRRECLDHLIVWDEWYLRRVLREYVAFYNAIWPHHALAQEPPAEKEKASMNRLFKAKVGNADLVSLQDSWAKVSATVFVGSTPETWDRYRDFLDADGNWPGTLGV